VHVILEESFPVLGTLLKMSFAFVLSLLHRGFIFACLPRLYLFARGDFKAAASRRPALFCKIAFHAVAVQLQRSSSALSFCKNLSSCSGEFPF